MKPEQDPQSDGKRSKSRRSFAKETRTEDVLEKDLWDLDGPSPEKAPESAESPADEAPEAAAPPETAETPEITGDAGTDDAPEASDAAETDESATEEESGKEEPASRTPIPIVPRSTRRDLVFKQNSPKKRPIHKLAREDRSPSTLKDTSDEFSHRIAASAASDDTFVDLDDAAPGDDAPATAVTEVSAKADKPATEEGATAPEKAGAATTDAATTDLEADAGKDSPPATSIPTPAEAVKELSKGLSKVERLGLAGFLVLLAAGIIFFFANSINKLPEDQKPLTPGDLPIAGDKISADKIRSYWREPNAAGGETFRRGTLLLPVVELGVSGGPGAVRVFFRDSDGATVGDAVTRAVSGESTVTIAATAGFDDQGMFAAYRTGETKPWKIEVFEGPSTNASGGEFKKLFEMPISTQRR